MFRRTAKNSPYITVTPYSKDRTTNNAARTAGQERAHPQNSVTRKTKKSYTQKEWGRFGDNQKQVITQRYNVTISDHQTRNEKIKKAAKKINVDNLKKGIDKFDSGMDQFDKSMKDFNRSVKKAAPPKVQSGMSVWGKSKSKSSLW